MKTVLFTMVVFAFAMAVMAVGAIFGNRCLRGSCGGPETVGPDGEDLRCDHCPQRKKEESDHVASS